MVLQIEKAFALPMLSARVEHYRREDDGSWRYRVFAAGDTISLTNGATLSIDRIYEGAFDLEAG